MSGRRWYCRRPQRCLASPHRSSCRLRHTDRPEVSASIGSRIPRWAGTHPATSGQASIATRRRRKPACARNPPRNNPGRNRLASLQGRIRTSPRNSGSMQPSPPGTPPGLRMRSICSWEYPARDRCNNPSCIRKAKQGLHRHARGYPMHHPRLRSPLRRSQFHPLQPLLRDLHCRGREVASDRSMRRHTTRWRSGLQLSWQVPLENTEAVQGWSDRIVHSMVSCLAAAKSSGSVRSTTVARSVRTVSRGCGSPRWGYAQAPRGRVCGGTSLRTESTAASTGPRWPGLEGSRYQGSLNTVSRRRPPTRRIAG